MMKFFVKIINGFNRYLIFAKSSIMAIWQVLKRGCRWSQLWKTCANTSYEEIYTEKIFIWEVNCLPHRPYWPFSCGKFAHSDVISTVIKMALSEKGGTDWRICYIKCLLSLMYDGNFSTWGLLRKKCPYLDLFWSAFPLIRTEYGVSLSIPSECGKIWARITPNTNTFHAVVVWKEWHNLRAGPSGYYLLILLVDGYIGFIDFGEAIGKRNNVRLDDLWFCHLFSQYYGGNQGWYNITSIA